MLDIGEPSGIPRWKWFLSGQKISIVWADGLEMGWRWVGKAFNATYTLRWQVELFIKRDKSIGGLDGVPNYKPETIYSWICAKQLLLLIARKIASSKVAIPPSIGFNELSVFTEAHPSAQFRQADSKRSLARDGVSVASYQRCAATA